MSSQSANSGIFLPSQADVKAGLSKPVPTALISSPFAHNFAYASQMGRYKVPGDIDNNPLTPFVKFMPPAPYGRPVALVVLNSLSKPLALTDFKTRYAFLNQINSPYPDYQGIGQTFFKQQFAFPANCDPNSTNTFDDVTKIPELNIIPGTRPYPRSGRHMENGKPALMGGLGVYGFNVGTETAYGENYSKIDGAGKTIHLYSGGVCSFSYTQDTNGKFVGPSIGVAFWMHSAYTMGFFVDSDILLLGINCAVTADVEGKFGDLETFYKNCSQNFYDIGRGDAAITAWCQPEPMVSGVRFNPSSFGGLTLTLWVRDLYSTLG